MKSLVFSVRALVCAALALAGAAPAAAQETPAEEPMRVEVAQDPMGVTRLAAGVLAALHNAGVHPSRGVFILRADSANANLNGSFAASEGRSRRSRRRGRPSPTSCARGRTTAPST